MGVTLSGVEKMKQGVAAAYSMKLDQDVTRGAPQLVMLTPATFR